MCPTEVAGSRAAWDRLDHLWAGTVARARALPPELLHERVDGEWSFTDTLRQLVVATDIWCAARYWGIGTVPDLESRASTLPVPVTLRREHPACG